MKTMEALRLPSTGGVAHHRCARKSHALGFELYEHAMLSDATFRHLVAPQGVRENSISIPIGLRPLWLPRSGFEGSRLARAQHCRSVRISATLWRWASPASRKHPLRSGDPSRTDGDHRPGRSWWLKVRSFRDSLGLASELASPFPSKKRLFGRAGMVVRRLSLARRESKITVLIGCHPRIAERRRTRLGSFQFALSVSP